MDREELDTLITALTNCESAEGGVCPEDCPMKDDEWKREGRAACRALVDDEIIVPAALIRRTVALLKAQEPRVMTLEEAKSASGYVIVQSHSCNILELQLIKDGFVYDSFAVPIAVDDLWWEGYNKHWRLWTSVPTDAQRAAEPWPKEEP